MAAKLFNGAFVLANKEEDKSSLISLMEEVESRFLLKICDIKSKPPQVKKGSYLKSREQLEAIRNIVQQGIQKKLSSEKILETFSNHISVFSSKILDELYIILGKAPCEFSLLGLGSLARREMNPYSDLEFAILIKKDSEKKRKYFHNLVNLLELRITYLGETEIKILAKGQSSPTLRGLSYDKGGNTPLGKQGYVELLDTPKKMARFQTEERYQEELILSNVLKGAHLVLGNKELLQQYLAELKIILQSKLNNSPYSLGQKRALDLLHGHLLEFESRIDQRKEDSTIFC